MALQRGDDAPDLTLATHEGRTLALHRERAGAEEAAALAIAPEDKGIRIRNVQSRAGRPPIVDDITLSAELFPGLTEKIFRARENTIYQLYQSRYGINVLRTDERLRAVLATRDVAGLLGLDEERIGDLDEAWKHLLIAQSHDVSLCEDWVGKSPAGKEWLSDPAVQAFISATGTPEENRKVNTWGTLGFRHLEVGKKMARETLARALGSVSAAIDTATASRAI